jgi:DDE family transposase
MAQPPARDQMGAFCAVVHDPRRQHPTTLHAVETLRTSTILATMCGAQHWVESAPWGTAKADWLAEFLALAHGRPSPDTCGRVFAVRDPASLHQAFVSWMQALADLRQGLVALEGKTLRRSLDRAEGTGPLHVVHAWASAKAVVLAQGNVDATSNESTARPELLGMLNLAGAVVTIDAMGGQGERARQRQEQAADSVLSWKDKQPNVSRDCAALFAWLRGPHPLDQPVVCGYDEQVEELVDQARFAHAGLAQEGDDLPLAGPGPC